MRNLVVTSPRCQVTEGMADRGIRNAHKLINEVAKAKRVDVQLEKIEELSRIMPYEILSTPGVASEKVVQAGDVPAQCKVERSF